jgi:hypothetical protein
MRQTGIALVVGGGIAGPADGPGCWRERRRLPWRGPREGWEAALSNCSRCAATASWRCPGPLGVDVVTGEGLGEALTGAECVIDAAGGTARGRQRWAPKAASEFSPPRPATCTRSARRRVCSEWSRCPSSSSPAPPRRSLAGTGGGIRVPRTRSSARRAPARRHRRLTRAGPFRRWRRVSFENEVVHHVSSSSRLDGWRSRRAVVVATV